MGDLVNLTGVGLAAITVMLLYRMASEHIRENTQAIHKLTEAIQALERIIQK